MYIFWRKKMVYNENNKDNIHCDYECCQCKKIFMILVILILTFMAGIMVGNCGRCRYSDTFYNKHHQLKNHNNKKFHRGMHKLPEQAPNENTSYPNNQTGGFLIEIDQTNWDKYILIRYVA